MNATSVGKPLHVTVISKVTKEFILERNSMNVISVEKLLHVIVIFKGI